MKINEVFFKNSNLLSSLNDGSGLWLFACFKDGGFIDAIRIGFMLGFFEGIDYGVETLTGDPNIVSLRIEVLTSEGLYTYIDQGFERKDFRHAINEVNINIGDNLKITQTDDNELSWQVKDKSEKVVLNLNLEMDSFHLYPSFVLPNNFIDMAVAPKVKVTGDAILDDNKYKVDGFGAMDQFWSKKVQSKSAKKYGYSHYEPIMWNEKFTSVLYYIKSSDDKSYLQDLLLILDDGKIRRLDEVSIEHLGYKESNGSMCPTAYTVNGRGKDLEIEYKVKTILRKKIFTWGYPEEIVRSWAPDFSFPLMTSKGVIKEKTGKDLNVLEIEGKGILEFVHVNHDPFEGIK